VGTIFGTTFKEQLVPQMSAAGVPPQIVDGFAQASSSGTIDLSKLTGVGDMGQLILAQIPAQAQDAIKPFIAAMVEGIHGAFSLATAQTFWLGVAGSVVALLAAVAIKEIPLRSSNAEAVPTRAVGAGATPAPTAD
jgi:hypothetical protein